MNNKNYNHFNYRLGFGCSAIGGRMDEVKSLRLLNYVYKKKIKYFDLAPSYGDGKCHKIFGKFLKNKSNKIRKQLFIATKIGEVENKNIIKYRKFFPNFRILKKIIKYFFPSLSTTKRISYSEDTVKNTIPGYLKDLNTNYIDCIFLHNIVKTNEIKKYIDCLIVEKKKRHIKYIGISLNLKNKISESILKKFDFIQLENSIDSRNFEIFKNKYLKIKSKFVFYGINTIYNNNKILEKFKKKTGLKNYRLLNLLKNIIDEKESTTIINSSKQHRIDEIILLIRLIRKNKSLLKIFDE